MNLTDTIIAPATAVGDSGIAIVRISGPRAEESLRRFFRSTANAKTFASQRLYHGILVDQDEQHVDEVMAVYMAAPHTYTCDDVVEIHCHGGHQIVKAILNLYFRYGLRFAEPGEFTYRAFSNGRLDLSQAEAVAQLIHSKSDFSRRLALSQVEGSLSKQIHSFTDQLRKILVLLEAWIDFPEEDLPQANVDHADQVVASIIQEIEQLTSTYNTGRVLAEGASILLVGRPNAGKSSLLNALLGEDRAIVTDIPGTTRDFLEEGITLAGVPVRLVDTAGLRQTEDPVEREGVRRAKDKISRADLVLLLIDGSKQINDEDVFSYQSCKDSSVIIVSTKSDLPQQAVYELVPDAAHRISIKTGAGLEGLKSAIAEFLLGGFQGGTDSIMLTEQRHYEALLAAQANLGRVRSALQEGLSLEFLALDIRESLQHLGQISGETTTDSVLAGIFSKFCIGK